MVCGVVLACHHAISLSISSSSDFRMSSFDKLIKVRLGSLYKRKFQGKTGASKDASACPGG
jgi:hypothetical protein